MKAGAFGRQLRWLAWVVTAAFQMGEDDGEHMTAFGKVPPPPECRLLGRELPSHPIGGEWSEKRMENGKAAFGAPSPKKSSL